MARIARLRASSRSAPNAFGARSVPRHRMNYASAVLNGDGLECRWTKRGGPDRGRPSRSDRRTEPGPSASLIAGRTPRAGPGFLPGPNFQELGTIFLPGAVRAEDRPG